MRSINHISWGKYRALIGIVISITRNFQQINKIKGNSMKILFIHYLIGENLSNLLLLMRLLREEINQKQISLICDNNLP